MIKNIKFNNNNELYSIISSSHVLSRGSEGTSYLVGKEVWKIFNELGKDQHSFRKIMKNHLLNIKSYAFIKGGIFASDELIGFYKPFVRGASLRGYDLTTIPIKVLVSAANKVCLDTETLSVHGIQTYDVGETSILFDGHHFCMIKTIDYKSVNKDERSLYEYNIKSFSRILFQNTITPNIRAYLEERPYLKKYIHDPYLLQTPGGFMMLVKQDVENRLQEEITTFKEAEKKLLLLPKKK